MTYLIHFDTDPPLTDRERANWVEFLRDLACCLERRDDTRLSPERQAQRLAFSGGGADYWRASNRHD